MIEQTKTITEETGKKLISLLQKTPIDEAAARSLGFAQKPVLRIRNNQIAAGVLGSAGLIIFALGVENLISHVPALSSPFVEIILGLILLSISGLLLKKLF
jgi:hypothetical protein